MKMGKKSKLNHVTIVLKYLLWFLTFSWGKDKVLTLDQKALHDPHTCVCSILTSHTSLLLLSFLLTPFQPHSVHCHSRTTPSTLPPRDFGTCCSFSLEPSFPHVFAAPSLRFYQTATSQGGLAWSPYSKLVTLPIPILLFYSFFSTSLVIIQNSWNHAFYL